MTGRLKMKTGTKFLTWRFLKAHGKFVVYDAEHCFDGFKEDTPYALATLHAAEQAGADIVTLCDTNGGSLPGEVAAITRVAREALRARIGIHTHDDIGLGVANALAALDAGATHVQGTINGYGETHRQLQHHVDHPNPPFQAAEARRAGSLAAAAH